MSTPPLQFGPFRLDIANARLTRDGQELELPPKSFQLLAHLAQRPGELVLKDQLLDAVWGRRFVSEGAVKTVVSELRAALGDDPRAPRWIETVQRRGYRFVGSVAAATPAAPAPAAPSATGNLPPGLPAPIGREPELDLLEALWDSARLVTLTGPAGVGKTRLALAAAAARQNRHAHGVWLVELAPLPGDGTDAATLRSTLARVLQAGPAAGASDAALVAALQEQDLLLVVDNAEHVLEALAPLVAHLHAQLPRLHLMLTSREPLQVPGERLLRVAPLALPPLEPGGPGPEAPALRLLVDRIAARLPGFAPDAAQHGALVQLCHRLDGLPLALELAAARVPVLGVHGLAEHLADDDPDRAARLKLLTQGVRTAAPHQRTLRAALDWSHALLTPTEQRVFRRLAVFRGGFSLAAAQQVAADPGEDGWAVLDALNALVDKSMVIAPQATDAAPRFGLLESLREHALEHLADAGDLEPTARRHLAWARAHWAAADSVALTEPVMPWTARLMPELDNLRAALRWGSRQPADAALDDDLLALLAASARFWQGMGLAAEGAGWFRALQDRAEAHPDPLRRAGYDLAVANLCRFAPLGPPADNLVRARRAAAALAAAGDVLGEYYACYLIWELALNVDESVDRSEALARMQALSRPDWSALPLRFLRGAQAQEARLQGRAEDFLRASRADMAAIRATGAQAEAWLASFTLMLAEHDQGHVAEALAFGQSVLDEIRAAGRLRTHTQLLCMHTAMRAAAGDQAGTRAALADALPTLGVMAAAELLLLALAWLAAHEGRDEDAALVLGWFESPRRGGGQYGPRTFTRRTAEALAARLDQRLGTERHAALRAAALELGHAEAVRRGQRVAGPERRRVPRTPPAPRTDGNPTAS